jgi:hypothetical protein
MCCSLAILALLGPRFFIIVWWLVSPVYFNAAFSTILFPILGFLFLPWLTLGYVLVYPGGVNGFDWVILGLGLLADVAAYGASGKQGWSTYKK